MGNDGSLFLLTNFRVVDLNIVKNRLLEKFNEDEFKDCFIVDIEYSSNSKKLQIFIDSDSDFGFDKCRKISRYLEEYLDQSQELGEKYTLEISSPGLSRPLKYYRQYRKNKGRTLKVILEDGALIEGIIDDVNEYELTLKNKNEKKKMKLESIKSALVIPSFK